MVKWYVFIIFLALFAIQQEVEATAGILDNNNTVVVRVTNERDEPVDNARVSLELRESGILGYSSTHIAFRHTTNGVYESRNPVPHGSTFEIHLSIDAPGYQSHHRVLTQSGPVRSNYSAQLSTAVVDEVDQPVSVLQMDPQDLSWNFQDDPLGGEGTVVDDPGFLYDATYSHTQPATISAEPDGATLSGRVQADIEGHWNPSYPEGLVFALSPDRQHILGFSYTSRYPHSGYFRIDRLPMTGDIILISFMPQVKRLHWMDVISMDEVVDASKRHDSYSLGTVWAHLRRPAGGAPHDLSSAGAGALKGAGYALQLMVLAGWISERAMNRQDYSAIDELTNRLYEYYQDGIEKNIVKADASPESESVREVLDNMPPSDKELLKDIDGNVYRTVQIGNQVWMADNLQTSRFSDGNPIPKFDAIIDELVKLGEINKYEDLNVFEKEFLSRIPSWRIFDNKKKGKYEKYYNLTAAIMDHICPENWRVASDTDWRIMESFLGMENSEVRKMGKRGEKQNIYHALYNSEFLRESDLNISWWTSTEMMPFSAWYRSIKNDSKGVSRHLDSAQFLNWRAIRCIKK